MQGRLDEFSKIETQTCKTSNYLLHWKIDGENIIFSLFLQEWNEEQKYAKGPSINDVTSFFGNFDPPSPLVIPCHDFEYPPYNDVTFK